ncbi:MAG: efflux RND transporter permease subunit [Planctomycetes bacterium]|nr:efflux RND transporter permease subunit [Planctomycetota bacterium]
MQRLAEICIRRPVFATMMIVAMVVIGIVGYVRLGVDRLPSVDLPSVRVQTRLPGASPEEVETEVSKIIEEAVNSVEGIDQLRSISGPGTSIVLATFQLDRDIDVAAQDVRDKVSSILNKLPATADPPVVAKVDNDSEAVITVALSADRDLRELTEYADKVVKVRLERSPGVGEVKIVGGLLRTMNLWLDADRLAAYDLPVTSVRDAVAAQNSNVPGGNVTGGGREQTLRTMGRLSDANSFEQIVVATVNGVPVRVADVGRAEDGNAERRSLARLDGRPTVVLEIVRQSGASTIGVIEGVKRQLDIVRPQLPADVQLAVIRDQSRYIEAALHEIDTHLILGSLLATFVVLLFMRSWQSTLIACVAIPVSVVATFAVMWALGFTLNSVTMLALVLMVGIVIDDAIVVLENVFRFVEEKGMDPMDAAREATAEIGLAVLATTLSLVVIFVPVSFMSSISGRFLYQFGITSAAAILVSLFVSFTLTPMMAARLLRKSAHAIGHDAAASRRGFYGLIDRSYTAMLGWSMRHRIVIVVLALASIGASVPLMAAVPREFTPSDVDEAEFSVQVSAPEGLSLPAMDEAMAEVEAEIRGVPGVRTTLGTVGGGFIGQVNSGSVYVRIAPHEERTLSVTRLLKSTLDGHPSAAWAGNYSQSDVMTEIDRRLKRITHLRCQVRNYPSFNIGGGSFDVDYVIRGPVLEDLDRYATALRAKSLEAGGFRGLDTTLRLDKPELRVRIDRERAADLGVRARDVGTALRLLVGGDEEVSRFRDDAAGEDYDVRLRLDASDRERSDLLGLLRLPRPGGGTVELSAVADVTAARAPSRIDRLDRQRMVSVRGGVAPGFALSDRLEVVQRTAASLDMGPQYTTQVLGRGREMERTSAEFVWAFVLSVVFMYLILASQFESLLHPLTILLSLPLSIPFALFSLWAVGGTLNLYSALGILVLFGVVKKNSILQIDHMNGLIAKGLPRAEAILQANRDRLRPILMTTLALVAGMLPLALGSGPGAEERRAVAVVVIGGQSLCLLLTLLVTPVAYSIFDDMRTWPSRRRAARATAAIASTAPSEPATPSGDTPA